MQKHAIIAHPQTVGLPAISGSGHLFGPLHLGQLTIGSPIARFGRIIAELKVGGLHHRYARI